MHRLRNTLRPASRLLCAIAEAMKLMLSKPSAQERCRIVGRLFRAATRRIRCSYCRQSVRDVFRLPVLSHSNLAGDEKGRVTSTTNMTIWSKSDVPALKTSIGVSAPCPFMGWSASA